MFDKTREDSKSSESRTPRRRRGIHGRGRQKLTTPKLPGYYLRWVNDVDTNIYDRTVQDDYDYVKKSEIGNHVGEQGDGNSDLGSRVSVLVDKDNQGNPIVAYLLKKKTEFHDADMDKKESFRIEQEKSLKRGTDETGNPVGEQYINTI